MFVDLTSDMTYLAPIVGVLDVQCLSRGAGQCHCAVFAGYLCSMKKKTISFSAKRTVSQISTFKLLWLLSGSFVFKAGFRRCKGATARDIARKGRKSLPGLSSVG